MTTLGLAAVVPPLGKGVYAEKLTPTGPAQFAIETDADGVVKLLFVGDELRADSLVPSIANASHSGGGSSPAVCDDTTRWAYAKQSETHLWRYTRLSSPQVSPTPPARTR